MSDDTEKLFGDKKIPAKVMLKRIAHYVSPEWKSFVLAFVLIIINVGLDIVLPLFISKFTDWVADTSIPLAYILGLSFGWLAVSISSQILIYFESMILQRTGQRIVYKLRMEVFEHIENMSQNQFNTMPVGSLVTRVANYTTSMSDLFTNVLVMLLRNALTIIGVYIIMFILSWKLSLVLLGFVAVVFGASMLFRSIVTKLFRQERQYTSDINTFLNENLSGMKIIQIFNQEKRKESEFNVKNKQLRNTKFKVLMTFAIYRPFITFVYFSALAVTFFMGIALKLGAGEIVAFYLYLSRFFNPVQNIADQINQIQKATTSSERLFNLLDVPPEVVDKENPIVMDHFEGRIEFKNVWFAYKEDEWILKDVSFTI